MLPWIFGILVLLNIGLFLWGYQHEKSLEPPATPVPQGRYEIRLLGEPQEPSADADPRIHTPPDGGPAVAEGAGEEVGAAANKVEEPGRISGSVAGVTGIAQDKAQSDETAQTAPEAGVSNAQKEQDASEPKPAESEASSEESPTAGKEDSPTESLAERTEMTGTEDSEASEADPHRTDAQETGADIAHEPGQPTAEPQQQIQGAQSPVERDAEVPADQVEGIAIPSPEKPGTEGDGATSDEFSEDTR